MTILNTYNFVDGDLIEEVIEKKDIVRFRGAFEKDSYRLATMLKLELESKGILASVLTFATNEENKNGISVYNELLERYDSCKEISVVYMGSCVLDILHSDRLIPVKEYLTRISSNRGILVNEEKTTIWYDDNCKAFKPDLDYLVKKC